MFKKADIVLAVLLIAAGLAASYILSFGQETGDKLVITADGSEFGTYSLLEDREIAVEQNGHINKVTIHDGKVSMNFSDCKGQDCVDHAEISLSGENIICLPNKVVLEIIGNDGGYDSIAK